PRLEEQLHDGKWQLILRALRHHGAKREYAGSLEIQDLLKLPAESMPFDDILLVAGDGTVVYQHRKAGPQFTTLASLLKARTGAPEKSGGEQAEESHSGPEVKTGDGESGKNAPGGKSKHAWRNGAIHLTDVQL